MANSPTATATAKQPDQGIQTVVILESANQSSVALEVPTMTGSIWFDYEPVTPSSDTLTVTYNGNSTVYQPGQTTLTGVDGAVNFDLAVSNDSAKLTWLAL